MACGHSFFTAQLYSYHDQQLTYHGMAYTLEQQI